VYGSKKNTKNVSGRAITKEDEDEDEETKGCKSWNPRTNTRTNSNLVFTYTSSAALRILSMLKSFTAAFIKSIFAYEI